MPQVALPDTLQLCRISGCLYTPYNQDHHYFASFIIDRFDHYRRPFHAIRVSRSGRVS
jgi:hypothetical protein